ncbi:hypothetical protein LMG23994_07064 [Cupriavidus pinatubonensis]|uniref:CO dehydrogenase flavoprotein C-terminal domain-containing protein n=2 Tax=Cupriavidus pinatubonensis TaxID=248026 RepID=A0ABM8Y4L7_9BURK|nr:hypothetical protein LMG23994_07064 [Cupriavidus pinatubonensis]
MGMGTIPMLAEEAAQILEGAPFEQIEVSVQSAAATLEGALKPIADIYNSAETKLHLAKVLLKRAVLSLATSEPQEPLQ